MIAAKSSMAAQDYLAAAIGGIYEAEREQERGDERRWHVSDISGKCPREAWSRVHGAKMLVDDLDTILRMARGRFFEDLILDGIQRRLPPGHHLFRDRVVALWLDGRDEQVKAAHGRWTRDFCAEDPAKGYREEWFEEMPPPPSAFFGHPDAVHADSRGNVVGLLEIKSVEGTYAFGDGARKPGAIKHRSDHAIQTLLYAFAYGCDTGRLITFSDRGAQEAIDVTVSASVVLDLLKTWDRTRLWNTRPVCVPPARWYPRYCRDCTCPHDANPLKGSLANL